MPRISITMFCLLVVASSGTFSAMAEEGAATLERPATVQETVQDTAQEAGALRDYLSKEDLSYEWHKVAEGEIAGTQYAELILTSQTWRDIVWKHRLFIIKPQTVSDDKQALLIVAGGKWNDEFEEAAYDRSLPKEAVLFASLANQLRSPVAVLLQVPQQPIFGGMVEDEIISYTFEKFLDTGDSEWPLLLPMVKSAVKAMDAVEEFCEEQWSLPVESFTVTGASKRGWTTWLTGASDERVTAIAPMVIDMLNMKPQLKHQHEAWGKFSPQIHDYTERNFQERVNTPAGEKLLEIVDPYAYRDSLTLPKMIILGTNDPYWTVDALNLYWPQLVGPKYVLNVPNNGHGLRDFPRVLGAVAAVHEQAKGGEKMPELDWSYSVDAGKTVLSIESSPQPTKCQIWQAHSETRDFRESRWTATEATPQEGGFRFEAEAPKTGYTALFGELVFNRKPLALHLSTNIEIIPAAKVVAKRE